MQFLLKLCCHGSIASGTLARWIEASPGTSALCAAVCYLKAESELPTAQKENSCKEMKLIEMRCRNPDEFLEQVEAARRE